ncbi:MAG: hypothetical protein HY367_02425 [Candidatus Aenigmarchaeota archaeon]|nr:hypothetical protein [Candidatus Aenigmarchaeota archaeon]
MGNGTLRQYLEADALEFYRSKGFVHEKPSRHNYGFTFVFDRDLESRRVVVTHVPDNPCLVGVIE